MVLPVYEVLSFQNTLPLKAELLKTPQAPRIKSENIGVHFAEIQGVECVPEHERNGFAPNTFTVITFAKEDRQLTGSVDQIDAPEGDESDNFASLDDAKEHLVFATNVLDGFLSRKRKVPADEATQLRVVAKCHYLRNGFGTFNHNEVNELTN